LRLEGLGERLSSPSGPANVFWCILGINMNLFGCLNDEGFPVCVNSIKRMRELLLTLRYGWVLYFSEVVPS